MNALVRKEIRMVLPAWIAAMILAIFPVWLVWPGPHSFILESPGVAVYAPFALGVLLLGLTPFGQELNFGTFSMLLAQPVSRRHLWLVKTSVLAMALGIVFAALCFSNHVRVESVLKTAPTREWQNVFERPAAAAQILKLIAETRHDVLHDSLAIGGLCALAAFASGLWTNLLFRNTSAAFWFSLLVPLGLGLLADKLFGGFLLIATLGIYSLAGFLWARKFFLRVQDTQWTGGLLSLPALFGSKMDSLAQASGRNRKPLRALFRKEFQLHQVNLLIAGLLLLTHLVVIVVRRTSADYFMSHRSAAMIWESWPLLWLAMPLLIGGVAVAEERKLGTLENFLCLPTTRRREFGVKLFVAFLLGIFLGGIMPLAVEWLGTLIGLSRNIFDMTMTFNWKLVSLTTELMAGSVGLTFVAFYASTLTRNLLQALGLALVLSLFASFVIMLVSGIAVGAFTGEHEAPLWGWRLISLIGWPVMVGTVVILAFRNFKQLVPGSNIWLRNFFTILAALACSAGLTTVIYHRVWEMWMPEEPEHRFSPWLMETQIRPGQTNRVAIQRVAPKLESSRSRVAVILPDGRLWLNQRRVVPESRLVNSNKIEVLRSVGPQRSGFLDGSKWREVAVTAESTFAIQADGSLWNLSEIQPASDEAAAKPKRLGLDSDWKRISGSPEYNHVIGLKADGTMWEWGTTFVMSNKLVVAQRTDIPTQVGTDSDWIAICDSPWTSLGVKSDGSIWCWRNFSVQTNNNAWFSQFIAKPERWNRFPDKTIKPIALSLDNFSLAAVAEDGSLWLGGQSFMLIRLANPQMQERALHQMINIGSDRKWQQVGWIGYGRLVAISRHGLWKWEERQFQRYISPDDGSVTPPALQGQYMDWMAMSPCGNAFFALAGDGQLCLWGDPDGNPDYDRYWGNPENLLMPSRIRAQTVASLLKRVVR